MDKPIKSFKSNQDRKTK